MAFETELKIIISASAKGAQKAVKGLAGGVKGLGGQLKKLKVPAIAAFAAAAGSAVLATKAFGDFENALLGVKTLMIDTEGDAEELNAQFEQMTEDVLVLATEVPVAISSINTALFDTVSAGVDASKAVEFVGVSAKLAVAGLTDVGIATDGMTSALNAYRFSADEADMVASKFFTAQKFGKTTIAELSAGFGLVGSSAEAMGVDFNELLASVSAVTTAGVRTNAAYTGMKAVLSNIAKPTADAVIEAKRLGIEFDATALRTKGLTKFMDDLRNANGFTKDSVTKLFGSVEAQTVAFSLTGAQAETYSKIVKELGNDTKTAATFTAAYNEQNASLNNQMALLKNTTQAALITIGKELAPTVSELVGITTDAINTFIAWEKENKAITKSIEAITFAGEETVEWLAFFRKQTSDFFDMLKGNVLVQFILIPLKAIGKELEKTADFWGRIIGKRKDALQQEKDAFTEFREEQEIKRSMIGLTEEQKRDSVLKTAEVIKQVSNDTLEAEKQNINTKNMLDKESAEKKKQLEQEQLSVTKSVLGSVASLMSSENESAFNIGKAASLALAGINIAEGITKAMAVIPPPFNFLAAAAIGAAGAVQVAQIAGTQFNPSGAADGVSSFGTNARDTIISPLNPKEIVVPTSFSEGIRKGDLSLGGPGGNGGGTTININGPITGLDADDVVVKLSQRLNEVGQSRPEVFTNLEGDTS